MSNIAVKFTDENYVTKSELSAALGMSSIDSFWTQILAYRNSFSRQFDLKNIHQVQFYATFSPTINQRLNTFIGKVSKLEHKLGTVSPEVKTAFTKEKVVEMIRNIAVSEGKKIGELSLRAMVNGTYRESNADHTSVINYKNTILEFLDKPSLLISENFLAKYYSLLLDEEELVNFYRTDNLDNTYKFKTTIIGKDYSYAQADLIPTLMDDFFSYTNSSGGDPFAKAIACMFYFSYIKPFQSYNFELSCIIAKAVISSFGYEKTAGFLNFEELYKDQNKFKKVALESERSGDLTYLILYCLPIISKGIDDSLDLITRIEVEGIKAEQYSEVKKVTPKVVEEKSSEISLFGEEIFNETEESTNLNIPPKKEDSTVSKPIDAEKSKPSISNIYSTPTAVTPKLEEKSTLSKPELKDYAKYICETNPSIKKQQAMFYVSHCSEGHFYSIQDYKSATKCVYETARTSMDNLAAEGYYNKVKIKNKFVYTPISKGDK